MNEIMPVLKDEEMIEVIYMAIEAPDKGNDEGWKNKERFRTVAKAQRDADRKWMVKRIQEIIEKRPWNQEAALRGLLQALKEATDG